MSGPPRKPPEQLQHHRSVEVLPPQPDSARLIPNPPPNLLPATAEAWERFWADHPSRIVVLSDWATLEIAFLELDEYHRCMARYRGNGRGRRMQRGSKGQLVRSPYHDMAMGHLRAFAELSRRFGMDPESRLRLRIGTVPSGRGGSRDEGIYDGEASEIDDEEPDELPAGWLPRDDEE